MSTQPERPQKGETIYDLKTGIVLGVITSEGKLVDEGTWLVNCGKRIYHVVRRPGYKALKIFAIKVIKDD